jgi:hypothetical protein
MRHDAKRQGSSDDFDLTNSVTTELKHYVNIRYQVIRVYANANGERLQTSCMLSFRARA